MQTLVISHYLDLEDFVSELIRIEEVVEIWENEHPGYSAEIISRIDCLDYTITVKCKRP